MRRGIVAAILLAGLAAAQMDRGTAFVSLLAHNEFAQAESYFNDAMKAALPEEKLRNAWLTLALQAGAFERQTGSRFERKGAYRTQLIACEFSRGTFEIAVTFDAEGRIGGLHFLPATSRESATAPASLVSSPAPKGVAESELSVNGLSGTLSLPSGSGPFAAALIVHGSGMHDRDLTTGEYKPYRDIAWGLAARGIAVLRYDKRRDLPPDFTVNDEAVKDAAAAVALLRRTPKIDPARVFVIGHSLGGMLLPRIAKAAPEARGFIFLAGSARPLEDHLVEQA